jgi:hypothetical protein
VVLKGPLRRSIKEATTRKTTQTLEDNRNRKKTFLLHSIFQQPDSRFALPFPQFALILDEGITRHAAVSANSESCRERWYAGIESSSATKIIETPGNKVCRAASTFDDSIWLEMTLLFTMASAKIAAGVVVRLPSGILPPAERMLDPGLKFH